MGNEVLEFGNLWWELESGETYVIYVDYFGAHTQMTVETCLCRIPLWDRNHELLNRI